MFNKIIKKLDLNENKILGSGYFSTVLEYDNNALKITTCEATYSFLRQQINLKNPNLPNVLELHGIVGKYKKQDVYSVLLEKNFHIYEPDLVIKASQIRNLYRTFLIKANFDANPSLKKYIYALREFSKSKLLRYISRCCKSNKANL